MSGIQIAGVAEVRAIGVTMEPRNAESTNWPRLVIQGNTLAEILKRADVLIEAAEDIKRHAEEKLKADG